MNVLHMKYALEVARLGSLNKAAEALLIAQPNISRSIKELEASLGITIFNRSAKGMVLTSEGEEFVGYAREILRQIDEVEMLYKKGARRRQRFSVCVIRACYVAEAMTRFCEIASNEAVDVLCKESSISTAAEQLSDNLCTLALVRYPTELDSYYKEFFEQKELSYELVAEPSYVLLMSKEHKLARAEKISQTDLCEYCEITRSEPYIARPIIGKDMRQENMAEGASKIITFDRASEYDILSRNRGAFMWVSPVSQRVLDQYGLVMKKCESDGKNYKDMLLYRKGYKLTKLDNAFITALCEAKRDCMQ